MLVYATKSGAVLDPQAVPAGRRKQLQAIEEQKAIILVPHDFPLAGAKRTRSKWLDDYSSSGTEVKTRLVATEVAYGNRDDCFAGAPPLKALRLVVSLAASRGRRIAFFNMVAAFVHALIDELVILLLPDGLGQGRTAVLLYKALYGTRKASRLWQRLLRDVLADADWKASVIFASMYTLGDQRGTLGCWGDDLLVEADEVDLDAVEAHLVKRLEVKVLARLGGKQSDEVGFLKRVLRYDTETGSFTWCSGKRYVQDAANTLQLTGRTTECKTADTPGTKSTGAALRDGDQKLCGERHGRLPECTGFSDVRGTGQT